LHSREGLATTSPKAGTCFLLFVSLVPSILHSPSPYGLDNKRHYNMELYILGTCTLALFLDTVSKLASCLVWERHVVSVCFDEVSRVAIPSYCVFYSFLGDVVSVVKAHSALPMALGLSVLPPWC
jgi:hypothetical protein